MRVEFGTLWEQKFTVEEAQLAPVIWSEAYSLAGFRSDTALIEIKNLLMLAITAPKIASIRYDIRRSAELLVAEVVENISLPILKQSPLTPEAYEYIAGLVERVISYYRRNPRFAGS